MSDSRPPGAPPGVGPAYFPPPYPPPGPRRRWPAIAAAAGAGAAVAATIAAMIATGAGTDHADSSSHTSATVTVTATPTAPPTPAPLPAAQADRATCNAWRAAGDKMRAASHALSVIPKGMTIADQAVRDNPDWSAAVQTGAALYGQAGDTLAAGITHGTTTILEQSATAAVSALHALSTADATLDAAGGNTYDVMHESSDAMDVLCERLAPR